MGLEISLLRFGECRISGCRGLFWDAEGLGVRAVRGLIRAMRGVLEAFGFNFKVRAIGLRTCVCVCVCVFFLFFLFVFWGEGEGLGQSCCSLVAVEVCTAPGPGI